MLRQHPAPTLFIIINKQQNMLTFLKIDLCFSVCIINTLGKQPCFLTSRLCICGHEDYVGEGESQLKP